MIFNFCLWNHNEQGRASCDDIADAIAGQLVDLGHECARNDGGFMPGPNHVNVLVEAFDPNYIDQLRIMRASGHRFVIIMTERPGRKAFNDAVADQDMRDRQKFFGGAAKIAEAVWCLAPNSAIWSRQFNPRSFQLELGHSVANERRLGAFVEPSEDFVFYGNVSPRRRAIMDNFERAGFTVQRPEEQFGPQGKRDALTRRCRVVLGIKRDAKSHVPSNSRFARALHLGRPVVAEPHRLETPWRQIIRFSRSHESFVAEAAEVAQDWRAEYDRQMAAFRTMLSPANCIGDVLARSGIT